MILGSVIFISILIAYSFAVFKLKFFQNLGVPKIWIFTFLASKLIATFFLIWIYTDYYTDRKTADIFKYYDDAVSIKNNLDSDKSHNLFDLNQSSTDENFANEIIKDTQHWDPKGEFFINDNRTIISLNLLILYFSCGFYPIHALLFTLASFSGLLALFYFFKENTGLPPKLALFITFISPSLMLWTSGILKESWLFFCLGFLLYFSQKIHEKFNWSKLIFFVFFLLLLIGIKQYVLIFMIPLILTLVLAQVKLRVILISTISITLIGFIFLDFGFDTIQSKLNDFNRLGIETDANSKFSIKEYRSKAEYVLEIPHFIYNVVIRPILPNNWNIFSILNSLESLALLLLLVPLTLWRRSNFNKRLKGSLLFYLILITILIGSTIPILGALVRYRIVLIPFYLIFIVSFYKLNTIQSLYKK